MIPDNVHNIGIKMSGGCDSSIIAYMLCNQIKEKQLKINLIPITVDLKGKAFQIEFAKRVIDFLENEFDIKFGKHYTAFCPVPEKYISFQNALVTNLYYEKIIDCHFNGITKNPPNNSFNSWQDGPVDDRTGNVEQHEKSHWPLKNIDKKGVYELYKKYNLIDTLFPITRSCESWTNDFSKHCGECWWCKEREWGFGKL